MDLQSSIFVACISGIIGGAAAFRFTQSLEVSQGAGVLLAIAGFANPEAMTGAAILVVGAVSLYLAGKNLPPPPNSGGAIAGQQDIMRLAQEVLDVREQEHLRRLTK